MDAPYVALGLTTPNFVTATQVDDLTGIAWPTGSIVKLDYTGVPGHGDIAFTWYEGKKADGSPYLPEFPASIDFAEAFPKGKASPGGWMIVGTDGVILNKNDQAKDMELWPKKRREEFPTDKIPKTEPRSVAQAIRSRSGARRSSAAASSVDEPIRLRVPAHRSHAHRRSRMRFPGQKLTWDSKALKVTNLEEANKFLKRPAYRKGWEYSAAKI
jgi:hypothetical protein